MTESQKIAVTKMLHTTISGIQLKIMLTVPNTYLSKQEIMNIKNIYSRDQKNNNKINQETIKIKTGNEQENK